MHPSPSHEPPTIASFPLLGTVTVTAISIGIFQIRERKQLMVVAAAGDVSADGTVYLIAGIATVALLGTAFPILFSRKDLNRMFLRLGEYKRAGNIYLEKCDMSELKKAGECFSLAGSYRIAAEVYAKGSFFHECLSACTKGNYFDLGQSCIRFGFAEDRSLPRSFLVNHRVVALGFQGGLFWFVDVMEWEESL
ncbi:hypothetical protein DH2020_015194 [Rehmannia glutinosa]|uniref:Uncharacterized protein n=1 Tax=Rehmannia glutinosa TaxID=99300 RepID=A0ABR0WS24_REHGL